MQQPYRRPGVQALRPVAGSKMLRGEKDGFLPALKALASDTRLLILSPSLAQHHGCLRTSFKPWRCRTLEKYLNLKQLQDAGLLHVEYEPRARSS